jgi:hypothetical protein
MREVAASSHSLNRHRRAARKNTACGGGPRLDTLAGQIAERVSLAGSTALSLAGSTASSLNSPVFRRTPNADTLLSGLKVQRQVVPTPPGEAHFGSYGLK